MLSREKKHISMEETHISLVYREWWGGRAEDSLDPTFQPEAAVITQPDTCTWHLSTCIHIMYIIALLCMATISSTHTPIFLQSSLISYIKCIFVHIPSALSIRFGIPWTSTCTWLVSTAFDDSHVNIKEDNTTDSWTFQNLVSNTADQNFKVSCLYIKQ